MPHRCEELMKKLESKKYTPERFVETHLNDFWTTLLDYIKENNKLPEKGLFKKSYNLDLTRVFKVLDTVLPVCTAKNFNPSTLTTIDQIYSYVFHPESPSDYRQIAYNSYFRILDLVQDISKFTYSMTYVIPFSIAARDNGENSSFNHFIFSETSPLLVSLNPNPPKANVVEAMKMVFNYSLKHWNDRNEIMINNLFVKILTVIYSQAAKENGWVSTPYGFNNPIPQDLHTAVLQFFTDLADQDANLTGLVSTMERARLIICILLEYTNNASEINGFYTLKFATQLISSPQICSAIIGYSLDLFISLFNLMLEIVLNQFKTNGSSIKASLFDLKTLFCQYFFTAINSGIPDPARTSTMKQVITNSGKDDRLAIAIFQDFLKFIIETKEIEDTVWSAMADLCGENEIFAVSASRIARLFAVDLYEDLYRFDRATFNDDVMTIGERHRKNRIVSFSDFISKNIDMIMKFPSKFVFELLPEYWEPHAKHQDVANSVPFDPMKTVCKVPDIKFEMQAVQSDSSQRPQLDFLKQKCSKFLSSFDKYKNLSNLQAGRLYSIIHNYMQTVAVLGRLPPNLKIDRVNPVFETSKRLFNACFSKIDTLIVKSGFLILNELMNTSELKPYLDDKTRTQWYSVMADVMLRKDEELSAAGFREATKAIRIGFKGAVCLIPVMLILIDYCNFEKPEVIPFLSSAPLLRLLYSFPQQIIDYAGTRASQNPGEYIDSARDVLARAGSITDTFELALKCVKKLIQHANNDPEKWTGILTVLCAMIGDELVQKLPAFDVLEQLLRDIPTGIASKSSGALSALACIGTSGNELSKAVPKSVVNMLNGIIDVHRKLDINADSGFLVGLTREITTLIITTYPVSKDAHCREFCNYLSELSVPGRPIAEAAADHLQQLAMFNGGYPFNESPVFPSSSKDFSKGLVMLEPNGTIIAPRPINEEDPNKGTALSVQTNNGQFVWELKPLDVSGLMKDEKMELTLPPITYPETELKDINEYEFQAQFGSVFDGIVKGFEARIGCSLPLDNIIESDYINVSNQIRAANQRYASHEAAKEEFAKPPRVQPGDAFSVLGAIGLIDPSNPSSFGRVNHTTAAETHLHKVNTSSHRFRAKAAIVYAGPGFDVDQDDLLRNSEGSDRFKEFCAMVGWNVVLKDFPGHTGGLDNAQDRTGESSLYYCDLTSEIMYHVSTMLPTNHSEIQQILKKKHIGNDHVQIIFCDSGRDYDPLTITCQFNHVTVTVYPLETGLYRIEMRKRDEVGAIIPIGCPMVVAKPALGRMINATVISAMTNIWTKAAELWYPMSDTGRHIKQLFAECRAEEEKPFNQTLCLLGAKE